MKAEYEPHLLYEAINITVELQYNVPLKTVYAIIEQNEQKQNKLTMKELADLIKTLGRSFQQRVIKRRDDEANEEEIDLKTKIKLMLELLHCELSNDELNQILKGELALEDALNKQALAAWNMFFTIGDDGKMRPNKEMVEQMTMIMQDFALLDLNQKYKMELMNQTRTRMKEIESGDYYSKDNIKSERAKKMSITQGEEKLLQLDRQRKKLKLYIAHMQGYDRDRDHDFGRGINMETGDVIDFGDIYLADKGLDEYLMNDDREERALYERDYSEY